MPKQAPHWMFRKCEPDETLRDSVSGEFFNSTRLESVIREALQNSLDARAGKEPASVRIFYSGAATAFDGNVYASRYRAGDVDSHYTNHESGLTSIPDVGEKCEYLTIEDFNTTGLTGSVSLRPSKEEMENDHKKSNYFNFFFRENRSGKNGAGSLGSWGAGKIMFMKASRLRTAFTYSVREDAEAARFLAGRTVLMSHSIGDDMFAPDGWFGEMAEDSGSASQRYMRKRPITDSAFIEAFCNEFHVKRKSEVGTTVVIPYLDLENENGGGEFSRENLVRAVLKNFMLAILDGDLTVTIETGANEKVVVLDKETIKTEKKYLPETPDGKSDIVTRHHYALASQIMKPDFPQNQSYELKHVGPNTKPMWCEDMFAGIDLKAVKKQIASGKCVKFHVPMTIQARSKTSPSSPQYLKDSFSILLRRVDEQALFKTAFYRKGLLIDSANRRAVGRYVSIVSIDGDELVKLLVASEPPSHCEWKADSSRVKERYFNTSAHITFVTSSVSFLIGQIEAADKDPDFNPLMDTFGIPIDNDEETPPKPAPKPKPDDPKPPEPNPPVPVPPVPPMPPFPEELLRLSKLQGKTGFTISMKADRIAEKGYPFSATYKMGYAPFDKTKWSPNDFSLGSGGSILVEREDPAQADIVDFEGKENKLTVTVKKQGAFRISVTGFDENRDLEISKSNYDYSSAVPVASGGSDVNAEEVS